MLLFCFFSSSEEIIKDKNISDIMQKTHPEYPDNEFEEVIIVLFTYAVVQVSTVVIKARGASIALPTVFRAS